MEGPRGPGLQAQPGLSVLPRSDLRETREEARATALGSSGFSANRKREPEFRGQALKPGEVSAAKQELAVPRLVFLGAGSRHMGQC